MKVEGLKGFKFPLTSSKTSRESSPRADFGDFLKAKIQEVDRDQKEALLKLKEFASGESQDLTGLTLALTRADLSFRLLLRVRNKVIEAYQEIMRMQI